jgi:hypothetical protein
LLESMQMFKKNFYLFLLVYCHLMKNYSNVTFLWNTDCRAQIKSKAISFFHFGHHCLELCRILGTVFNNFSLEIRRMANQAYMETL